MLEIYKRIRARREELGISQEELAKRMGYKSRSSINKIEKGENDIPQSKIVAFAQALRTTPEALMGWEQSPAPASDDLSALTQRDSTVPSKRDMNDLAKFLNKTEVLFDGDTYSLSEEDQQKLRNALEFVFWDAKRQNKRKKD